jgi:hypothetical protein
MVIFFLFGVARAIQYDDYDDDNDDDNDDDDDDDDEPVW